MARGGWLISACAIALAGCAGPRVKPMASDAALLDRQSAREASLQATRQWTLKGRLGVSDGRDSGSGALEWTQRGDEFRFIVHAPVTGKTWTLAGRPGRALLEGLRETAVEGTDATKLLERELGWRVPVAQLTRWALGLRASGAAQMQFRTDGLPAQIIQDGWTVDYLDYDEGLHPPLPTRIFASRGDYKVRLAIRQWTLP